MPLPRVAMEPIITAYVALLRAVNVGGTSKLPMTELVAMCEKAGFEKVRTYIASANAIFASGKSEKVVKAALERRCANMPASQSA